MSGRCRRVSGAGRLLVAVGLAVTLAACGPGSGSDPGTSVGTETSTPSGSIHPTSDEPGGGTYPPELAAPTPGPEIQVDNPQGAVAAVAYYFALLDYARSTGDTVRLAAMSGHDCRYCEVRLDSIATLHDAGGWVEGGESTLIEPRVQLLSDGGGYLVRFDVRTERLTIHHGDGTSTDVEAETFHDFAAAASWTATGFEIVGVDDDTES